MKKAFILILLIFSLLECYAQRYLNPVFTSVNTTTDIVYGNALNYLGVNEELRLDLYQPANDIANKRPLIIYLHGGGFTDANQTKSLLHIVAFCDSFALRGYVVASIDYRLDTSISHRAIINAMHDARAAVRFFKANASVYKIDTSRIFMGGESAGAVSSLNVNYINKAEEVLYPDVAPFSNTETVEGNSGTPGYSSKTAATLCFCGGTQTIASDPLFNSLAIEDSSDPPLLLVHGSADNIIPVQYGLEVSIRSTDVGVPNLFYPFHGATHCPWFYPLANSWAYLDTLIDYTSTFLYAAVGSVTALDKGTEQKELIKVFPNPAKDYINMVFENNTEPDDISMFNSIGENVLIDPLKTKGNSFSFDIGNLPSGIYFIHGKNDDKIAWSKKVFITND